MCAPEALRELFRRLPELQLWARAGAAGGRRLAWAVLGMLPSTASAHRPEQQQPPPPPRAFPEEQFVAVCRELGRSSEGPEASWQLMAESLGFSIYRLRDEKSGLYEYKVYGTLDDCPPELCADVYMDLDYRINWDQFLKELCEKTQDGRTVIYWEVKFPFPLTNRDYVFIRERQDMEVDGKMIYVVLAKSVNSSKFPEKPGIVRVKNYRQSVAFQSDGKKGSKVFMSYFDDPGGKLPSWMVNWTTKTGVPNFLKDMQKACHTYQKRKKSMV
ncbi:phosphatidylcholine transfer protein isoform X1 [Sceloporus undulatus]|uniref:phosphatidylcholine transfer protein isoform X1 n=1 Tax=Sceloporus undulatus TaxID=8520 RepID=UPI001C4B3AE5|nr:phosphatidylcholine transfer protein isoform X1 [Sceloporus undulatus]